MVAPPIAAAGAEAPSGAAAMSLEGVCVQIGGALLLRNVSLSVGRGEVLGVIGPNGSGKTTLLRTMAGLLKPSRGSVVFEGRAIASWRPQERARRIAYVAQNEAGGHPFTALEVALMGRYPHLSRFQIEGARDREVALGAMARTETEQFAERRLSTLSGGERQRVMLARALAQGASTMLLDEPTAALDLKFQITIMELIRAEAARGVAVVAVFHDLTLAANYCDRLLLLQSGSVAAEGSPREVITVGNLRDAFEVEASVGLDPLSGRPRVILLGARKSSTAPQGTGRVHLICGAGSGRYLMRTLRAAGYAVTAGVLGEGDADREAADQLGIEYVPSRPFSPVSPEAHRAHVELVRGADAVVVCDMPVGRNNLRSLEAATEARRLYLVHERPFSERDYTGGEAGALYGRLANTATTILADEVLAALLPETARGKAARPG